MKIAFYFDPSCPFSWITSRWLLQVQTQVNDLEIDWRPFSLALKNNTVVPAEGENEYAVLHRQSLRVLRVMLAAQTAHDIDLIVAYTAFGRQKHIEGTEFTDEVIQAVLTELSLPTTILEAADSTQYDAQLQNYITEAVTIVGEEIGVPTLLTTSPDGSQRGYFGPVLQALPSKEDGLKLWHSIHTLTNIAEFYELKRKRPAGNPDTASTARC